MSILHVEFTVEGEDQTTASSGDQPVTTFVVNDFWQHVSATSDDLPLPADFNL